MMYFSFFVSGPGITGPYSNNSVNIAFIPGTNTPVAQIQLMWVNPFILIVIIILIQTLESYNGFADNDYGGWGGGPQGPNTPPTRK